MRPAGLLMLTVGAGLLLVAGTRIVQVATFVGRASHATGRIVEAASHPRIRFAASPGTDVEFVQNGFVTGPAGTKVPVVHATDDPAGTARVARFWPLWGEAAWCLLPGLGFVILPLLGAGFGLRGRL